MRSDYNQTATNVLSILDQAPATSKPGELNAANLRRLDEANEAKDEIENQPEKVERAQKP